MTDNTTPRPPYSCPVTGLPFVRKITFLDRHKSAPHEAPCHVTSRVEFDGERVTVPVVAASVTLDRMDVTRVDLWAHVDDVTPPFEPTDRAEGRFAPATIGGHPFMAPYGEHWDAVGESGILVRCVVYVAEVEVR